MSVFVSDDQCWTERVGLVLVWRPVMCLVNCSVFGYGLYTVIENIASFTVVLDMV